jgi:salicylate hydroxylase
MLFDRTYVLDCSYDMYQDIDEKLAFLQGRPFTERFVNGLPVGLKLPNGVVVRS